MRAEEKKQERCLNFLIQKNFFQTVHLFMEKRLWIRDQRPQKPAGWGFQNKNVVTPREKFLGA